MTYIRREIVIAIVEDIDTETIGIEVTVPDGMTTLEAIGLMEIGKTQHMQSKHNQGPTIHQEPTVANALAADSCICTIVAPHPACPVHHGRRARGPKPPPVGPGCTCDGSGRTCPRHGTVI